MSIAKGWEMSTLLNYNPNCKVNLQKPLLKWMNDWRNKYMRENNKQISPAGFQKDLRKYTTHNEAECSSVIVSCGSPLPSGKYSIGSAEKSNFTDEKPEKYHPGQRPNFTSTVIKSGREYVFLIQCNENGIFRLFVCSWKSQLAFISRWWGNKKEHRDTPDVFVPLPVLSSLPEIPFFLAHKTTT